MAIAEASQPSDRVSWFYNPAIRSFVIQAVMLILVFGFVFWLIHNTTENLAQLNIASGFAFLNARAGFNVQTFLPFTPDSTYGFAILAGLVDTIVVAVLGIIIATIVGLIVGVARLSNNFLIRMLATVYVETFRNIPPLLVIVFWYFAVIAALPAPRDAIQFGLDISLSNRGIYMPKPVFGDNFLLTLGAFFIGLIGAWLLRRWARARQMRTGEIFPTFWVGLGFVVVVTGLVFLVTGHPQSFDWPVKSRFNLTGGMQILPEFASLLLALGLYTASFIAEIVRAGVLAVSHGQSEAARALGLRNGRTMRLIVLPQALRVIIPPLTSEYLNLTKNTSLAVAIGFADLVAVGGSILNQTGQSIEVVGIWMAFYLGLSLLVSFLMNLFNRRVSLTER